MKKRINDDKTKELVLRAVLSILLFIVLIVSLVLLVTLKKELGLEPTQKKIPEIKENYSTTKFNVFKEYDNFVSYDEDTKEIILASEDENIDYYTIGKYGKIYNIEIINEKNDEDNKSYDEYNNYRIYYDEDEEKYYFTNTKNHTTSEYYNEMSFVMTKDEVIRYLLLTNYDENDNEVNYLINITNGEIITINARIDNINELYDQEYTKSKLNNSKYLIVYNEDDKAGLMDLNGNMVLDYKYDSLSIYNSDDTFIANQNDKLGVINYKDEIIQKIIYDDIYIEDNYTIAAKNQKFGIFYKDSLIVDFSINYDKSIDNDTFYTNTKNDMLYLTIMPDADENSAAFKNNTKYYLINKKGIQRTLKGEMTAILTDSNNENEFDFNYYYKQIRKDNTVDIQFYDLDFYEYYKISLILKENIDYNIYVDQIGSSNSYEIYIDYDSDDVKNEIYYVDLFNSKIVNEEDVIYNYFSNGYGYTLNSLNELKIYKNKKLLTTYEDIDCYLGGYYFLKTELNSNTKVYNSTIYQLTFEKESNN